MKGFSHRVRIVGTSLLLSLAAMLIFNIHGGLQAQEIYRSINTQAQKTITEQAEYNALALFTELEALSSQLKRPEFTTYTSDFLNLVNKADESSIKKELERQVGKLYLDPEYAYKLYILGADSSQKSFVSPFGSEDAEESPPSIEDLEYTGLLDELTLKSAGIPIYFDKGELTSKIHKKWNATTDGQIDRSLAFARHLEGKLLLANSVNFSLELLVLRPEMFDRLIPERLFPGTNLSISTQEGKTIWQSRSDPADNADKQEYEKSLAPYGLKLAISFVNDSRAVQKTVLTNAVASFAFVAVSLLLSIWISGKIVSPINELSKFMRIESGKLPLKKVPGDWAGKRWLPHLSIRSKVHYLFMFSVGIPIVIAIAFYLQLLNSFSNHQQQSAMEKIADQTGLTVGNEMKRYERIVRQLAANEDLHGRMNRPADAATSGSALSGDWQYDYSTLGDMSYFAMFDTLGKVSYSSIFSDSPSLFRLEPGAISANTNQDLHWQPSEPDIFRKNALKIVANLYKNGQPDAERIGFIQAVMKPDVFRSIPLPDAMNWRLYTQGNELLYDNESTNSEKLNENRNNASLQREITGTGRELVLAYPKNLSGDLRNRLLLIDLIVLLSVTVVCMLAAHGMSYVTVRTIRKLQSKMVHLPDDYLRVGVPYRSNDELGVLVKSFNDMIGEINHLMKENIDSRTREQALLTLKSQAELNMLQQQINPHFLYNTLESINMEAQASESAKISTMVSALAQIFRYSISKGPEVVPLSTEIKHTQNYITIQQIRFRDRFTADCQASEEALSRPVLKFILQPLVENAIQHGLSEYTSGGELRIEAKRDEGYLKIVVSDNGVGMNKSKLEEIRGRMQALERSSADEVASSGKSGFGMVNVFRRLQLYYGGRASFAIESKPMKGTTIALLIPYSLEDHDHANQPTDL